MKLKLVNVWASNNEFNYVSSSQLFDERKNSEEQTILRLFVLAHSFTHSKEALLLIWKQSEVYEFFFLLIVLFQFA